MSERGWGIASYVLVGSGLLGATSYVAWLGGMNSGDIASWVQAIGSIGAIVGSFYVGQMQAKAAMQQSIDCAEREKTAKKESIQAVVQMCCVEAMAVAKTIGKYSAADALDYWRAIARGGTQSAIATMDTLPFHEIGDAQRVMAAMSIRSSLLRIAAEMNAFEAGYMLLDAAELARMQSDVAYEEEIARTEWKTFQGV